MTERNKIRRRVKRKTLKKISTSSDSESERGNKIFLKFGIDNVNNKK